MSDDVQLCDPEPDEGSMKLRALLLVVASVSVCLFATAGAASGVGQLTVSNASPIAGAAITMTSTGWSAGHDVTIALSGSKHALARVAADATGSVHARVTIPADAADANVLSVTGTAASGVPQQIVTSLAVRPLGHSPAPTRPWSLVLLLLAIVADLLILSLLTAKPLARFVTR